MGIAAFDHERKLVVANRTASSRVMPKLNVLNAIGVAAGAEFPPGLESAHMPITGRDLLCEAIPDSSSAVTSTESVRLFCPGNQK